MTWEDFLDNIKVDSIYPGQTLTNIECPKCGRHIYLDETIALTSYPRKYHYWCSCGWEGHTTERWIGERSKYV